MEKYDYSWKIGLQFSSNTKLQTNKALAENTLPIDRYDGYRYLVQAICPAKPTDNEWAFLPETVVHTLPVGSLSEDELGKLRKRAKYTPCLKKITTPRHFSSLALGVGCRGSRGRVMTRLYQRAVPRKMRVSMTM